MRSSKAAARAALLLGVLAVLAIPGGVVVAQQSASLGLLEMLYIVVPCTVAIGLLALLASRRARYNATRSLTPARGVGLARIAAWAGLYAGVTGALALAVYGVLRWAQ